jgi:hypothetical protein
MGSNNTLLEKETICCPQKQPEFCKQTVHGYSQMIMNGIKVSMAVSYASLPWPVIASISRVMA